jgi:hypothetical protein
LFFPGNDNMIGGRNIFGIFGSEADDHQLF